MKVRPIVLFRVHCLVSEEDKRLPSPFTQAPTASMIFEKEKQAKERAIPPGLSKLRKYREKHEPSADKVGLHFSWQETFHFIICFGFFCFSVSYCIVTYCILLPLHSVEVFCSAMEDGSQLSGHCSKFIFLSHLM